MKQRMLFLALFGLGCSLSCTAQKLKDNEVPVAVKLTMEKKFPGITKVKWSKEDKDFESEFMKDGKEMSAVFKASGTWKETETEIKVNELPQLIKAYMAEHVKGKKIREAAIIHKQDGSVVYEAEAQNADYLFDAKGNLLKIEKEGEEKD